MYKKKSKKKCPKCGSTKGTRNHLDASGKYFIRIKCDKEGCKYINKVKVR